MRQEMLPMRAPCSAWQQSVVDPLDWHPHQEQMVRGMAPAGMVHSIVRVEVVKGWARCQMSGSTLLCCCSRIDEHAGASMVEPSHDMQLCE